MNDGFFKGFQKVEQEIVSDSDILKRLNTLLKFQGLNSNNEATLESLKEFYKQNQSLTVRQYNTLDKLEKKISKNAQKKYNEWRKNYTEDNRIRAIVCAKYYRANPPYFSSIVNKILDEENFIPTEKQYRALCENKYAIKVIEASFAAPLYEIGNMVQGRKNAPLEFKDKLFSIMATDARPVIHAAKGAKIYLLLPFTGGPVIECEERYLKNAKHIK